jgi:2-dehydropantoate 2-reductase
MNDKKNVLGNDLQLNTNQRTYLIIGSGKAARHLTQYFSLLKPTHPHLTCLSWNRTQTESQLQELLPKATHVIVAIRDSAIESFIQENLKNFVGVVVHLSGALEISGAVSAHPLMTFGPDHYDLKTYQKIPFILTKPHSISDVLPDFQNPSFHISKTEKPLYHALCVVAGNFSTLLWVEAQKQLQCLGLPKEILFPYLEQTLKNFERFGADSLTGPIARNDQGTIDKNIQALSACRLQEVYQAFANTFAPKKPDQEINQRKKVVL